uniref:Sushi domain-containing protein n=1 Tax=Caenorhabditis tropicalis TaxID=1561998 RepID=A0A1I7U2M2_9PELO
MLTDPAPGCIAQSEINPVYTLSGTTCSLTFSCPSGFTPRSGRADGMGALNPATGTETCEETGANAGKWYLGAIELTLWNCGY